MEQTRGEGVGEGVAGGRSQRLRIRRKGSVKKTHLSRPRFLVHAARVVLARPPAHTAATMADEGERAWRQASLGGAHTDSTPQFIPLPPAPPPSSHRIPPHHPAGDSRCRLGRPGGALPHRRRRHHAPRLHRPGPARLWGATNSRLKATKRSCWRCTPGAGEREREWWWEEEKDAVIIQSFAQPHPLSHPTALSSTSRPRASLPATMAAPSSPTPTPPSQTPWRRVWRLCWRVMLHPPRRRRPLPPPLLPPWRPRCASRPASVPRWRRRKRQAVHLPPPWPAARRLPAS